MQYIDYSIAKEKLYYLPVSLDAVYYVMADNKCMVHHSAFSDERVLIISLSGRGAIRTKGKEIEINQGELLMFDAPKEEIRYQCMDNNWNFWWFEFRCQDSSFLSFPLEEPQEIRINDKGFYLCEETLDCLKQKDAKTASCLFSSLLCLLTKECTGKQTPETRNRAGMFRMAEQYILRNLPTATVKSTAQYLNVSERTLLNLFQSMLGMPTVEYIQKRKIDEACRQLSFGENTIGEIAEGLGYADQFVFSKVFSKYMGISPSKYRKQEYLLKYIV